MLRVIFHFVADHTSICFVAEVPSVIKFKILALSVNGVCVCVCVWGGGGGGQPGVRRWVKRWLNLKVLRELSLGG